MINIPIVRQNDRESLKKIIKYKHEPAKTHLKNVYNNILNDYLEYYKNRHTLEQITSDTAIDKEAADALHDAYKSSKEIGAIKAKITEAMPPAIKELCPYCMLSKPGTYDHYLGKAQFPEHSVISKNLVPCCSSCNEKKSDHFLSANGNRLFISFYFDKLPKTSFLIVDLDIDKGIPYIKNMYINSTTGNNIDEIIKNHFQELNLFEDYKVPMSNRLSCLIKKFKSSKNSKDEIIKSIKEDIDAYEDIYGTSYWLSCLYKGIINNNDILDYLEAISMS